MFDWIALAGNSLLFCLVFGMSCTVEIDCVRNQIKNSRAILTGMSCQFFVLPLLGFATVRTLKLPFAQAYMLLCITCSPGGSYSNWWCSMFNADLALSVSMTAISTLVSMVMMPANLLLYTRTYKSDTLESLDFTALFTAIALVTAAVFAGIFCSAKIHSRHFNKLANHLGNAAGVLLIIFSATMTNTGDADSKIWARDWSFYVATALPCIGALFIATGLSLLLRLHRPEVVTVAIEVCYQNIGIASSLALTTFDGDELNDAMGVPFFYGICEMVLVGVYCVIAWKASWTKAPADAPICTVIWTSYEVLEQELKEINQIEVDLSCSTEKSVETQEGNILTTYFNLSWLDPSPDPPVPLPQEKEEPKIISTSLKPASAYV